MTDLPSWERAYYELVTETSGLDAKALRDRFVARARELHSAAEQSVERSWWQLFIDRNLAR